MHNDMSNDTSQPLYRPVIPSLGTYHIRYSTTPESFSAARQRRIEQLRDRSRKKKMNILRPLQRFTHNE